MLSRQAKAHESPALEGDAAHLRTDALTSAGVLVGLALVQITGDAAFDSITALVVAVAIVVAGIRIIRRSSGVLVDEALPDAEMDRIEAAIAAARTRRSPATTSCAPAGPAAAATSTSTSSTAPAPASSAPTSSPTQMRDAIEAEIPQAEVLIHVEPETSLRDARRRARLGPVPLRLGLRLGTAAAG